MSYYTIYILKILDTLIQHKFVIAVYNNICLCPTSYIMYLSIIYIENVTKKSIIISLITPIIHFYYNLI